MGCLGWAPIAFATPGWQIEPPIVLSPETISGRSVSEPSSPRPAMQRIYGSETQTKSSVDLNGTAPGILLTE